MTLPDGRGEAIHRVDDRTTLIFRSATSTTDLPSADAITQVAQHVSVWIPPRDLLSIWAARRDTAPDPWMPPA